MRSLRRFHKTLITSVAFFFVAVLVSCSQNALLESAKRDTDAALLFDAKKKMNSSLWTDAITTIGRMSATGQAERATKVTLASAYAGRCGLDLIRLADQISSSAGTNFFAILGSAMRTATGTSVTDCISAETTLLSISTDPAALTADENMMLSFVGFSKIGAILATYADLDDDGSADVGFDACNTGDIPEAMVRQFGTGITIAVASLNASGSSIASDLGTAVTAACTTLAGVNPAYDFCSVTDPAVFSADHVKALGGLIHTSDNPGVGTCAGDIATCVCP